MTHPSWCATGDCTAVNRRSPGAHVSRPVILDPDEHVFLAAAVRVVQWAVVPGYLDSRIPLVELRVTLPAYDASIPQERVYVVLRGRHAEGLGRMLVSAGKVAADTPPGPSPCG